MSKKLVTKETLKTFRFKEYKYDNCDRTYWSNEELQIWFSSGLPTVNEFYTEISHAFIEQGRKEVRDIIKQGLGMRTY